jgi:L-aspartate oxidase
LKLDNAMSMSPQVPRYLVPFEPRKIPHYFADIVIVGGGLAGLRAALSVDAGLSVVVVTKETWNETNSNYAQGGIASVMDPADSFADHVEDTLTAGGSLCDRHIVEEVVKLAPDCIAELVSWGTKFDSHDGQLNLGREGGHQHNRILHAMGDATGREIMRAVNLKASEAPNVQIWSHTFTIDLLVHEGRCRGALIWNPNHGRTFLWAKQTILCTGGAGQLYRESTNPAVATGDGHAMAYRAGAKVRDMEFVQFHPTVLYVAGSSRSLITEAMRGEGAFLIDANGYRFMPEYDPRAELAPRDVVAQAIVAQMEKTRRPNVFLTLKHLNPDFVRKRFPGIAETCQKFGIDIATDPIPVRPGAHYMIGGVIVDQEGRTSVPGLWGAGEVTSSGLHGANRLASNSLLEGLVFGMRAGKGASRAAADISDDLRAPPIHNPVIQDAGIPLDVNDILNSLRSLMWRSAGVTRNHAGLVEARDAIQQWAKYVQTRQFRDPTGWELQNLLLVAQLVILAALQRTESRGVHYRSDFPQTSEQWNRHFEFQRPESVDRN